MVNLGIKDAVKDWMKEKHDQYIKKPVVEYTEALEKFITEKVEKGQQIASTHSQKAKEVAYKPIGMYHNHPTYHRGLFWIAIGLLIVLWIVSGS